MSNWRKRVDPPFSAVDILIIDRAILVAEHFAWRVIQAEHVNTQPDGLRTLGEIRLQQGNLSAAEQFIQQSLNLAQANQDKILAGYAWRALGEVQLALGNPAQARGNLDQAIILFGIGKLRDEIEKTRRIGQTKGLSFDP